jgi:alpha-L-arabinofuranosidase
MLRGPRHETERHGPVDTVATVTLIDDTDRTITVLAVNRHLAEPAELSLDILGADHVVAEIHRIGGPGDRGRSNVADAPDAVTPRVERPAPNRSGPSVTLEPVSWTLVRLIPRPS